MKNGKLYLALLILTAGFGSCSKSGNDQTTIITPTVPSSNPISPGNISGFVKGTLTTGNSYTITGDLTIKAGDTLASQQGVTVIIKNNAQITVQGVLNLVGTQSQPIEFNSDSQKPGSWGGFQCDSAQAVTIKWTHIDNTGGPDPGGDPRKSVSVTVPINVDIEDSWFTNGQDDLLRLQGGCHITILRNTILCSGSTDGEAINIKSGATGVVAYNVVYSQAGSGIKMETSSTVPIPQTSIDVYNNTLVSNGWRRGAAEPGRGISIDLNARANIYNNLMVNDYQGLEIFAGADTINTKYGNNLFYASVNTYVDTTSAGGNAPISIRANFYPGDGVGKPKASDLISTAVGDKDPQFKSYDGKVATPNGAATGNDFHLNPGSPAIGKGNLTYNADIGAYTSDGKGNKH
ncbi:MAG: right-handed parallel beta-helix repeat-containing protein [Bacteroidota bacterium]|nr:right-handed parallel beta-helix repeat-containing protein [Bacteroidota bacterium]MDP4217393.1 right-handed parallel beta-helix repeat-containing protein [Bacteroidota bacterium]MDP4245727.1 right-handed parallel beta-helix repeat-containing protein [Bacteroidota bacterium]MDP4255674.1 right-handed parallel beta-helix repeat-containing protein [Bacteroidota bacterium]MDP4258297.1 right-handed parallel beta-helix repeat-containing protein [Bacteroidota bacterium]